MPNKAKAWDIVNNFFQFNIMRFAGGYSGLSALNMINQDFFYIKDEEAKVIQDCITAEEDSIDKIKADFKALGYVEGRCFNTDYFKSYTFEYPSQDYCITIDINLETKQFKVIPYTFGNEALAVYIKTAEWKLINRILRLYGIEV